MGMGMGRGCVEWCGACGARGEEAPVCPFSLDILLFYFELFYFRVTNPPNVEVRENYSTHFYSSPWNHSTPRLTGPFRETSG